MFWKDEKEQKLSLSGISCYCPNLLIGLTTDIVINLDILFLTGVYGFFANFSLAARRFSITILSSLNH